MDQDALSAQGPQLGLCGADAEIFQRVWQRVMPQARPDCPIQTQGALPPPEEPTPPARVQAPEVVTDPMNARLQHFIAAELGDWRYYRAMATRGRGACVKTLAAIAQEEERHARRLSAAYFLVAGVRYWPIGEITAPAPATYLGALRERYWAEREGAESYREVAGQCADPTLRDLFLDLAEDEAAHAHLLRALVEQA